MVATRFPHLLFVSMLVAGTSACEDEPEDAAADEGSGAGETQAASTSSTLECGGFEVPLPVPPPATEAVLEARLDDPEGAPRVVGRTNMPDGARLHVELAGNGRPVATAEVTVSRGCFSTEALEGLGPGHYDMLVRLQPDQPADVAEVIGEKGARLRGRDVARSGDTRGLVYRRAVAVGDVGEEEMMDRELVVADVRAKELFQDLIYHGTLRHRSREAGQCENELTLRLGEQLQHAVEYTKRFPSRFEEEQVRELASHIRACTSCAGNAMERCLAGQRKLRELQLQWATERQALRDEEPAEDAPAEDAPAD